MPLQANVKQFVQNRESISGQGHLGKRSLTPQPAAHHEQTVYPRVGAGQEPRATSRDGRKNDKKDIKRQEAAKLKLTVPNTIGKQPAEPPHVAGDDVAEVTSTFAHNRTNRTVPNMLVPREPMVSAFDDTQSIHFDDSASIGEYQDTWVDMHPHSRQRRSSPNPSRMSTVQQPYHIYEERPAASHERVEPDDALADWQVRVDAERQRQGQPPKYGKRFDNEIAEYMYADDREDEGYDPDGDYAGASGIWENTPSRTRTAPEPKPAREQKKTTTKTTVRHPVPEEPPSPPLPTKRNPLNEIDPNHVAEPPHHQHVNRFKIGKAPGGDEQADAPKEIHTSPQAPQGRPPNIPQPAFSSKVSSYHESSSEEDQPHHRDTSSNTTPSLKRSHQDRDLDFDMEILRTKTIADLDAIPFTADPSAPPLQPALDANGNPMTLAAKLTNLTKMRPEDQRQLFKLQTDGEREQTAAWFLDKFQSDMQRLMAVRLERRKIALKFELEVKERERRVQVKRADVERELEGLRKGGVQLIGGRTTPSK